MIFGTESWLGTNIKDHEVFPSGYSVYRKDREIGRGGGVFIAVKDHIMSSQITDFDTDCEILWVKISIASCKSLYLASYYRPNATDHDSLTKLEESIAKVPKKNSHIWIAGDMNLPGLIWRSGSMKNDCPSPAQHTFFLDILADHGLVQVVDSPTREENVIDLLAVNNPTLVNRVEVIPGISDHDAVFAEIDITPQTRRQTKREVPIYRKADWSKIEDKMKEVYEKISDQIDSTSVDSLWNMFKSTLLTAISEHVPHRNASNRDRPPVDHYKDQENDKCQKPTL